MSFDDDLPLVEIQHVREIRTVAPQIAQYLQIVKPQVFQRMEVPDPATVLRSEQQSTPEPVRLTREASFLVHSPKLPPASALGTSPSFGSSASLNLTPSQFRRHFFNPSYSSLISACGQSSGGSPVLVGQNYCGGWSTDDESSASVSCSLPNAQATAAVVRRSRRKIVFGARRTDESATEEDFLGEMVAKEEASLSVVAGNEESKDGREELFSTPTSGVGAPSSTPRSAPIDIPADKRNAPRPSFFTEAQESAGDESCRLGTPGSCYSLEEIGSFPPMDLSGEKIGGTTPPQTFGSLGNLPTVSSAPRQYRGSVRNFSSASLSNLTPLGEEATPEVVSGDGLDQKRPIDDDEVRRRLAESEQLLIEARKHEEELQRRLSEAEQRCRDLSDKRNTERQLLFDLCTQRKSTLNSQKSALDEIRQEIVGFSSDTQEAFMHIVEPARPVLRMFLEKFCQKSKNEFQQVLDDNSWQLDQQRTERDKSETELKRLLDEKEATIRLLGQTLKDQEDDYKRLIGEAEREISSKLMLDHELELDQERKRHSDEMERKENENKYLVMELDEKNKVLKVMKKEQNKLVASMYEHTDLDVVYSTDQNVNEYLANQRSSEEEFVKRLGLIKMECERRYEEKLTEKVEDVRKFYENKTANLKAELDLTMQSLKDLQEKQRPDKCDSFTETYIVLEDKTTVTDEDTNCTIERFEPVDVLHEIQLSDQETLTDCCTATLIDRSTFTELASADLEQLEPVHLEPVGDLEPERSKSKMTDYCSCGGSLNTSNPTSPVVDSAALTERLEAAVVKRQQDEEYCSNVQEEEKNEDTISENTTVDVAQDSNGQENVHALFSPQSSKAGDLFADRFTQTKVGQPPVSVLRVHKGDLVLVTFDPQIDAFIVLAASSPVLYIVKESSVQRMGLPKPGSGGGNEQQQQQSGTNKPCWVLAKLTDMDFCQIKKENNRYNLPMNTKFYRVSAQKFDGQALLIGR